jgi:hypothetical protein
MLAREYGMTAAELGARMSAAELAENWALDIVRADERAKADKEARKG